MTITQGLSRALRSAAVLVLVAMAHMAAAPKTAAESSLQLARLSPGDGVIERGARTARVGTGVLGLADIARYRELFELQASGAWDRADVLIARLDDEILLGYVLAQRYLHPTAYRSSYEELADWLEHYADHPQAGRIHRLAMRRQPVGAPAPIEPLPGYLNGAGQEIREDLPVPRIPRLERDEQAEARVHAWRQRLDERIADESFDEAMRLIDDAAVRALLHPVEHGVVRGDLARALFAAGHDTAALRQGGLAARDAGQVVPRLHWQVGLAAWRSGRMDDAARHFTALANAQGLSTHEQVRAAFWAARAHLVGGKPQLVNRFLRQAAHAGHDFYGFLARAMLGQPADRGLEEEGLNGAAIALLLRFDGARRAMALGQLGMVAEAEHELRKLGARARPELLRAMVALADQLDLPAAQMRLAVRLSIADGRRHEAALFPLPRWRPEVGFALDRALILAFMRAESGFDPMAESAAGAQGLMQLMPETAVEVAERNGMAMPDGKALREPETSIDLGQAYMRHLLETDTVDGGLIELAIAYNAGLSRLARWKQSPHRGEDPLLFVETLPFAETRAHLKKVMANLWTYRALLGQDQPSLRTLAANVWPAYDALDPPSVRRYAGN